MRILFEFKCGTCSHAFESLESRDTREVECPECGATADRMLSPGAQCDLMQRSLWMDGQGTSHDRFTRTKERQQAQERRYEREHGEYFQRTPGG